MSTHLWIGGQADKSWTNPANWEGDVSPESWEAVQFNAGADVWLDQSISIGAISVSGDVMIASSGATLDASHSEISVPAGATLTLQNTTLTVRDFMQNNGAASVAGTVVLDGSTLSLVEGNFPGTVRFNSVNNTPNTLIVKSYDTIGIVENLGPGDRIEVDGSVSAGDTAFLKPNGDGTYALVQIHADWDGSQTTVIDRITLAPGVSADDFTFTAQDGSGLFVIPCFLAGTLIATPDGLRAVEELQVGDVVLTLSDPGRVEVSVPQKIIWTGRRVVRPACLDEAPVRICKNSFSEKSPFKDLLVTPEHCLFVNGRLIPARMLVNGRSVLQETSFSEFEVFHIETERHAIIAADGLLTETYLDTGNRKSFRSVRKFPQKLRDQSLARNWAQHAAAPLETTREAVEPLYRQIEARAVVQGIELVEKPKPSTPDAAICLQTPTGKRLTCLRDVNGSMVFMVPPEVETVLIVSRTARPSDTIGPFVDDRRSLGVLVSNITLTEGCQTRQVLHHLEQEGLEGWAELEGPDAVARWTLGAAVLPLGPRAAQTSVLLALRVQVGGPYPVAEDKMQAIRLRA